MKFLIAVLVSLLSTLNLASADSCLCTLFIVTDQGVKDQLYSTLAPWSGSCSSSDADTGCKDACLNMAKTMTNDGDLNTHPMGPFGPNLGDLACMYIGGDVGLSTFEGQFQACDNPAITMTLPTKQSFCCKSGVWPNGNC